MKKQAMNPYLPNYEYIPDGEPYVFGERIYIYGSHDRFNGSQFCMNDYVCWSAPVNSLGEWRYEGIIYRRQNDPIGRDGERLLFAPDVAVGPDGRFYLYYAFDFSGIISVAVCEEPAGEYQFYGYVRYKDGTLLGKKKGDAFQFDPAVLVDGEDIYLYTGFCPDQRLKDIFGGKEFNSRGASVVRLKQDMLTISSLPAVIIPDEINGKGTSYDGHAFFEAASIRKIGSRYYFIYSSVLKHELCYAVSDQPDRGFAYGGTLVSNGDIFPHHNHPGELLNYGGNNHGSLVRIGEQWYIFYHRHTNRHQFSRQGCAEKVHIDADGLIRQAEMTSCGLNDGPLEGWGIYPAAIACNLMSRNGAVSYDQVQKLASYHPWLTQDGGDRDEAPGQYICNMTSGATAGFKYFSLDGGGGIKLTVRGKCRGYMRVATGTGEGMIAQIPVFPSDEWEVFESTWAIEPGVYALYFTFIGEGSMDFSAFELTK